MSTEDVKLDKFMETIYKILPEFNVVFEQRYKILQTIDILGPIGRRSLSDKLNMTERTIRKQSNIMKEKKLLESTLKGMIITGEGKILLNKLDELFYEIKGLSNKEYELAELLNVKKVIIAPIKSDNKKMILSAIGKFSSDYFKKILSNDSVIGITGGTTMESLVTQLTIKKTKHNNLTVVPARGSLGNKIEYQANTIAERLADKLGCDYKLLFTQDNLSKESLESLKNEPEIKETLDYIDKIDLLLFGIGNAYTMAKRRSLENNDLEIIQERKAVGETFGYYFNQAGEIVYEINTIGINLNKFTNIKNLIAVAGGTEKVEAIKAISKLNSNLVLVTDESVANKILSEKN